MHKVTIVVLADTTQSDSLGRIVNALIAVKEFKENNDDVQLIFTGTGTKWPVELAKPEHQLHEIFNSVKENIAGACGFCAAAYGVTDSMESCGIKALEEYGTNMSFVRLLNEGRQVITF